MPLNYLNPNDWGKSPLTDNALRLQQLKAENRAATKREINSFICRQHFTMSGTEYLATHQTIDDHPYAAAFSQFLGNGIDPDIANILALGSDDFDLISKDFNDPLRQRAMRIFRRFEEMGYWDKLPQSSTAEEAEFDEAVGFWRKGEYISLSDLAVNAPEEQYTLNTQTES